MTQEKQNVSHLEIKSEYICENQQGFIDDLLATHEYLTTKLKVSDSTWDYGLYNIFAASSPSLYTRIVCMRRFVILFDNKFLRGDFGFKLG